MTSSGPRILIIDDDPQIVSVLTLTLEERKFQVQAAYSGKEGLRTAYNFQPDLILLDISMPGMNGIDVLEHLSVMTDVPVIMLTGMSYEGNQIRCMENGAADYMAKGTSMEVLVSHIHARLRTHRPREPMNVPRRVDEHLEVDVMRRRIRLDDDYVSLTPLQWRLLQYLLENEGRVASYQSLLNAGWDDPRFGDLRGVKVQISLLREKLRDSAQAPRYIHTIREEGYLFEVRNA